jgi:hypothetical protein
MRARYVFRATLFARRRATAEHLHHAQSAHALLPPATSYADTELIYNTRSLPFQRIRIPYTIRASNMPSDRAPQTPSIAFTSSSLVRYISFMILSASAFSFEIAFAENKIPLFAFTLLRFRR